MRRPLPRKGVDQCAAASLLHGAAFGLRASLACNQVVGAYRMHQRSKSGSDSPSSSYVPVVAFVALAELVRCEVNVPGSSV